MQPMDWARSALDSEIAYSKALKSEPIAYPTFIHLYNALVPWGGDFNRAIGVQLTDFHSFAEVVYQVESIHHAKKLEKANRYDIYPPALNEAVWCDALFQQGYRLETVLFFCAPTLHERLPSEFAFKVPSAQEYSEWFCRLAQARRYYTEQWFEQIRPLQLNFIRTFQPYWLLRGGEFVGWVYCAVLGEVARLFEVEISPTFRGQGLGQRLLQAIRIEGHKLGARFILLQAGENLRPFYEKAGFRECTSNSILWLKE